MVNVKQLKGYEGLYSVYSDGKIYSHVSEIFLKPHDSNGYLKVDLYKNGKKKPIRVHRAVCLAFLNNPELKPDVNHIDGCKTNNKVENLEWCTAQENAVHALKNNLLKPSTGEIHSSSKLKNEDITYIRESYIPYCRLYGCTALSRKFGVSNQLVSLIVNNKRWKSV